MSNLPTLLDRANRLFVGVSSSPARNYKAVGGEPVFIARGEGPYVWDATGQRYVDYLGAFGPLILGHGHPAVVAAVTRQVRDGTVFGAPTELEVRLAERLREAVPSMERLRFVVSGTEAVMSAVRLARAATGRTRVVKFEGCYHGHADLALVKAGSGAATTGAADSAGVPEYVARDVTSLPFNDLGTAETFMAEHGGEVACILVEPIVGNFGVVWPEPDFLPGLRRLADRHGALLIFDEVITAFRVCYGGAQRVLGVEPDLTCLGKIIGGGLPAGAYGGRAEIMELLSPKGPTYQAGTLAGNPLSCAAGLATLDVLGEPGVYGVLEARTARLAEGVLRTLHHAGVAATAGRAGAFFTIFFGPHPVRNFDDCQRTDAARFASFFHALLREGVMLAPSRFEAWMVSLAHTDAVIEETLGAVERAALALTAKMPRGSA